MAPGKSQPKHRVSVPAKSSLKSSKSAVPSAPAASSKSVSSTSKSKGKQPVRAALIEPEDLKDGEDDDDEDHLSDLVAENQEVDEFDDVDMENGEDESGQEELDTDEDIEGMKADRPKSKKNTKKRKAATTSDVFAATLSSLLDEPATKRSKKAIEDDAKPQDPNVAKKPSTVNPILSLSAPSALPPSTHQLKLERQAKRQIKQEKIERKDRARVKDVIEGWAPRHVLVAKADQYSKVGQEGKKGSQVGKVQEGIEVMAPGGQEWERGLRKVAQRGVIKLFNAILVSSNTHSAVEDRDKIDSSHNDKKSKKANKDNLLGRGAKNQDVLTKEGFLGMLKNA